MGQNSTFVQDKVTETGLNALNNYNTGENRRDNWTNKYQALERELQSTVILKRRKTHEGSSIFSPFPFRKVEFQNSRAALL